MGEVHDCGDVRLANAIVNVDSPHLGMAYFSADESHPRPVVNAPGTFPLGRYAALDIAPGPAAVAAMGQLGKKSYTLGFYRAQVFPDALTLVTLRGLRPFQVP
jgi:hypothetical protein